ncbi:anchored repeat-type ABC transporter ATP-binding subunit [Microbacterium sediminicola]|uniref:Anchored repeat-type ABC transporter ATP-binding subunit n=1 Tax=Microbacterium sediminicola TaxID=415210 RepID=A0ABN2HYQ8_9MICO
MSAGADPALDVHEVSVDLGGRRVLSDVSLSVTRGELVALLGPNGAGKTTLLRAILGVQPIATGQVRVEGRATKPGRTAIGYVPQRHEFAWDFPISVAHAVASGLTGRLGVLRWPGRSEWDGVAEALERVRMTDLADRPIGQLSGGQRQRILVARALVLRPALLLLDEPFTGLDMPTQELLSELFAALAHEGRAVLMTTHDLLGAIDVSDRLALLNRTVVAAGPPRELVDNPQLWAQTFGVGENSALLRMVKAAAA